MAKNYSWIGDDCPPQWRRVGTIDVADPADVAMALDRGRKIGSIYDGKSYSVAEPCAADIYVERESEAREECTRRGLDPDDDAADGASVWMVVDQETQL